MGQKHTEIISFFSYISAKEEKRERKRHRSVETRDRLDFFNDNTNEININDSSLFFLCFYIHTYIYK